MSRSQGSIRAGSVSDGQSPDDEGSPSLTLPAPTADRRERGEAAGRGGMSWVRKPLDEVADFCLGKMLDQKKNKGVLRPYLANVNVRWGEFVLDDLREMRFEDHELERFGVRHGDIVMCEGGEPGRCAIWKNQMPGMMIQKAIHRIRPHSCLDHRFLYYTFLHYGLTGQFAPLFTGATIKHLPREKLALLEIAIPPLPVQRTIAGILSAYDDLIENNTRRIAILEEMAQALYREWFSDPSLNKTPRVTGDLTRDRKLEIGDGYRAKNSELSSSGLPFLRAQNIINNGFLIEGADLLCPASVKKAGDKLSKPGDVVMTSKGTVGRFAFVTCHTPQFVYAPQLCYWRSLDKQAIHPLFLLCWMQSKDSLDQVGKVKGLTDMADYVSLSDQRRMTIGVPSPEDQTWFVGQVEPIQALIDNCRRRVANLRTSRDLLLPKLISGQLDVEHLDIDTGADLVEALG